ncbi:spore protein [Cohnella suwonensis]|uniref:Spore protein n=1 Tax=Cohnella suwonensis TaxID=696072 RepID=A0ABW0M0U5_9BACL
MTNAQGPSKSGRDNARSNRKEQSPTSPGFDKKLDGPNRPST